jgi:hypothetical protein
MSHGGKHWIPRADNPIAHDSIFPMNADWYRFQLEVADRLGGINGPNIAQKLKTWKIADSLVNDGNYFTGAGTDNTPILQAEINKLAVDGGTCLVIPQGIYKLSSQVTVPSGVSIIGQGKWSTILFAPNAFANNGGLIRINGTGGFPTNLSGVAVLAQVGGAAGAGIVSVKNGVFIRDVWVNGFTSYCGIILSQTDNFLSDFAVEICAFGIYVTESDVNISNGTVYDCLQHGVLVSNNATVGAGAVHVDNVRATQCPQAGMTVSTGKNVIFTNCSAAHNNSGQFVNAGIYILSSSNVTVNSFHGNLLNAPSTTGIGIRVEVSNDVNITASNLSGWDIGIRETSCDKVIIGDNICAGNRSVGIYAAAGNNISIVSNLCSGNGTATNAGTGILSSNSAAFSSHMIANNNCTTTGGGYQNYGINASLVDNGASSGYTKITGNAALYNNTANINITGKTVSIFADNNYPYTVGVTLPSIASTDTINLIIGKAAFIITGTTAITSIAATGFSGETVKLIFSGALTLTDGGNLKLAGNFVTTADDVITLVCDGTSWYEQSRSAN